MFGVLKTTVRRLLKQAHLDRPWWSYACKFAGHMMREKVLGRFSEFEEIQENSGKFRGTQWNSVGFCMALHINSVENWGKAGFSGKIWGGGGFSRFGVSKGFGKWTTLCVSFTLQIFLVKITTFPRVSRTWFFLKRFFRMDPLFGGSQKPQGWFGRCPPYPETGERHICRVSSYP